MADDTPPENRDTPSTFPAELARWRTRRRLSKKALAEAMGFDPSYVNHVEHGRHAPSEGFARRAETTLGAGGALWDAWYEHSEPRPEVASTSPTAGLVVELDDAELRYADGNFIATMRRRILNTGVEPITRYLVRISSTVIRVSHRGPTSCTAPSR